MAKLWKALKVLIFSLGALTLALILYGLIVAFVVPLFKGHGHMQQASTEHAAEVVFEKKEGVYKLVVKSKETDGSPVYLITVSKDNKPVVQSYRLPTQKYHLEYLNIYDASFVPLRGNDEGIVLFSAYADDEGGSDSHVWFLKASDGTTNVREVIELSNVNRSGIGGLTIVGNRRVVLPYHEGFHSEPFIIPVAVLVGDTISIAPLLNREGADMMFAMLKQKIKAREEKMPKDKGNELAEDYRKAGKEMNEALVERTVLY